MVGGREGPCKKSSDGQLMEVLGQPFMVSLGQLVSVEVPSLGVSEALETLSGLAHRALVVRTGKRLPREGTALCGHS